MCGIACYIGKEKQTTFLINALKKLEYRGYDSSGIASVKNNEIKVVKASGNIKNLEQKLNNDDVITCAISHTRWATHGKPNEDNAHPHLSKNKTFAIVHNGIIENYQKLKDDFSIYPNNETDTAVVAELLEKRQVKDIFGFIKTIKLLQGSFAISCIVNTKKSTMFLAKEKSPLYVSKNKQGDFMVASDPVCFLHFSRKYYVFNDGEFAKIENNKITFYNAQECKISKKETSFEEFFEDAEKDEYSHFMLKEIMEEKKALLRQVEVYRLQKILEKFDDWFLFKFNEVKFIACGTAYHAGLMGAKYIQKILNKKASAEIASEFVYQNPNFVSSKTLYVFISQSGETADTLRALEMVKQEGATTIALTNVLYSSLSKNVDYVLPICAGVEIAVASTKAYVCMLSAIYLFCEYFKGKKDYQNSLKEISSLAFKILEFDKEKILQTAKMISRNKDAIFIGKDMDYVTALEASLKLKEVSYINANTYPSGELKHGFLALIEKGTPLFVFANQSSLMSKTESSTNEAIARGADVVAFSNNDELNFQCVIKINEQNELLAQILAIAPMQFLAYHVSIEKNINPDQPRNLAKSVTVE